MGKNAEKNETSGKRKVKEKTFAVKLGAGIGKGIAFLLAAMLLVGTFVPLFERNTAGRVRVTGSESWMAKLPDDTKLSSVQIPGTHDSATQFVQLSFFSKCQGANIGRQLDDGYRYLDIRLGVDEKDDAPALKLMHGFTSCKESFWLHSGALYLDTVLAECYDFLKENPTETVVFAVKKEHGDESIEEFQNLLNAYVQENRTFWYTENEIPVLGEVRGKLVLVRRYEDEAGLADEAGLNLIWEDQPGNEDTTLASAKNANDAVNLYVQDRYEYNVRDKWSAFCKGIEMAGGRSEVDMICLNFLSTKGTLAYGHPYFYARRLNRKLLTLELEEGQEYGWVILDFAGATLAEHVYRANFEE